MPRITFPLWVASFVTRDVLRCPTTELRVRRKVHGSYSAQVSPWQVFPNGEDEKAGDFLFARHSSFPNQLMREITTTYSCSVLFLGTHSRQEHITERLLPVRERLIAQIKNQQRNSEGGAAVAYERVTVGSSGGWGDGKTCVADHDDAGVRNSDETAVSDGWMEASKTAGALSGLSDPVQNTGGTLAKPCSSLSLGELDLCGDGDGDDCGGAFLVGSDCDEDGTCIGLDLYDLGDQVFCYCFDVSCRSCVVFMSLLCRFRVDFVSIFVSFSCRFVSLLSSFCFAFVNDPSLPHESELALDVIAMICCILRAVMRRSLERSLEVCVEWYSMIFFDGCRKYSGILLKLVLMAPMTVTAGLGCSERAEYVGVTFC